LRHTTLSFLVDFVVEKYGVLVKTRLNSVKNVKKGGKNLDLLLYIPFFACFEPDGVWLKCCAF
jgi:hypothetical protein